MAMIRADITALPEKSIEVKKKWQSLEQLKLDQTWQAINNNLLDILKVEIAPLMQWVDIEGQLDAIGFDNAMHRMELSLLTGDLKIIKQVEATIFELGRLKLNLNQFNGVRAYIEDLLKIETWATMDYDGLEHCRKTLRDLMQYRGNTLGKSYLTLKISDGGQRIEQISDRSAPRL